MFSAPTPILTLLMSTKTLPEFSNLRETGSSIWIFITASSPSSHNSDVELATGGGGGAKGRRCYRNVEVPDSDKWGVGREHTHHSKPTLGVTIFREIFLEWFLHAREPTNLGDVCVGSAIVRKNDPYRLRTQFSVSPFYFFYFLSALTFRRKIQRCNNRNTVTGFYLV